MIKTVCAVYQTKDYNFFHKLMGNREVVSQRKALLIKSIQERGWIRNPIIVNEKMEIVDGQGRFEALKELQMPIEYVISPGATIADCIALNIKQGNWKNKDYVKCYADMGREDYIVLLNQYGKYKHLKDACIDILAGQANTDGSGCTKECREGILKIVDMESLTKRLTFADQCMEIIGSSNGRTRLWSGALKFVFFCENIKTGVFLKKLSGNRALIVPCANLKQVLECFERIYNYGTKKNKIYFIPEWDKYLGERRTPC